MKTKQKALGMMSAAVLMSAAGAMAGNPGAGFYGTGDLPGGPIESYPNAVSENGVVVGSSYVSSNNTTLPFIWTKEAGIQSLNTDQFFDGMTSNNLGSAISADGTILAGSCNYNGTYLELGVEIPYNTRHGFYWTAAGGNVVVRNEASPTDRCTINGMTADGSKFIGDFLLDSNIVAGVWTASTGWTAIPGPFPALDDNGNGYVESAWGCSTDAAVLTGTWADYDQPFNSRRRIAYRWTASEGVVLLPDVTGGGVPQVGYDISDDGLTIVGETAATVAFRWTAGGGTASLGFLPGRNRSSAQGVSGDGLIVVGSSTVSGNNPVAFIWDEINGMRSLKDVAIAAGISGLDGWTLREAVDISSDGRYITGWGMNAQNIREGYLIDFGAPEEPTCPADFNGDDVRDVSDLFAYINAWLAKTTDADFNADTTVDVSDLFAYINAWLAGC